jgi:hypothetical protein
MGQRNSHKAKPRPSSSLQGVKVRETIPQRKIPRRLGTARGKIPVPPEFFEPLPEELLRAFEGRNS